MFSKGDKVIYRVKAYDGGDDFTEKGVFIGMEGSFISIDRWDGEKKSFFKTGYNLADIAFITALDESEATPEDIERFSHIDAFENGARD